jgi:PilZ domain-containing protein
MQSIHSPSVRIRSSRQPQGSGQACLGHAGALYENRRYARRKVDVRVRLLTRRESDGRMAVAYARTADLSRGGACVTLSSELSLGTEVLFCVRLPGSDQLLCLKAVVIRRRGFRAGLRFLQPAAEQRLMLCKLRDA